jgi:hypothetical protein
MLTRDYCLEKFIMDHSYAGHTLMNLSYPFRRIILQVRYQVHGKPEDDPEMIFKNRTDHFPSYLIRIEVR